MGGYIDGYMHDGINNFFLIVDSIPHGSAILHYLYAVHVASYVYKKMHHDLHKVT